MAKKKHIHFSYKPVSNAGGGKSATGKGAGSETSSAAQVISYVSGEKLDCPRTQKLITHQRDDVALVEVHNWSIEGSQPTRKDLQRLADAVVAKDPRKNGREGAHYIVALQGDRMERWDPELAEKNAKIRLHTARRIVGHISREAPGAYVFAIHRAPTKENPENWHLHIYGTRREVEKVNGRWELTERNIDAYGGHKRGPDGTRESTFGGVTDMMKRLRPKVAEELEAVARYYGQDRSYEYRSFDRIAADENVERERAGLPLKKALIPTRHEGPMLTRYRRALAGLPPKIGKEPENPKAIEPKLGKRQREIMAHNDAAPAKNQIIEQENKQIAQFDASLQQTYNPVLRALDDLYRVERRRMARGEKNPKGFTLSLDEQTRYNALEKKAMQLQAKVPGGALGLGRELKNLPDAVKQHLAKCYPLAGGAAIKAVTKFTLEDIEQQRDRGRGDGWTRSGVFAAFGMPPADAIKDDE